MAILDEDLKGCFIVNRNHELDQPVEERNPGPMVRSEGIAKPR